MFKPFLSKETRKKPVSVFVLSPRTYQIGPVYQWMALQLILAKKLKKKKTCRKVAIDIIIGGQMKIMIIWGKKQTLTLQ